MVMKTIKENGKAIKIKILKPQEGSRYFINQPAKIFLDFDASIAVLHFG
jgi:hypothetical protein